MERARARLHYGADVWQLSVAVAAVVAALPVITILGLSFSPAENIWPHLIETALPRYVGNTLILVVGVGVAVFLTGVTTAYLVTTFEFPFRRQLEFLLLLPFAFPSYVIAYLYTDLLEFSGPVQGLLRHLFGWELARDYWFPEIRSMGGAILLMGLVLYPYVYLMARASFLEQSPHYRDACRLMGRSHFRTFLFVSLPVARPAVAIGVALALMETINDIGTVEFFSIQTLSVGLFDVWLNMNNLGGAAQISMVTLTFILILIGMEYSGRRKARFYQSSGRFTPTDRVTLAGGFKWGASLLCLLPVLFGFLVPMVVLVGNSVAYFDQSWTPAFRSYAANSLFVSLTAAICCTVLAVMISYAKRLHHGNVLLALSRVVSMGYAVPGSVLAVGIVVSLGWIDNSLDGLFRDRFGFSTGLLLSGSAFSIILAYVIRFMAISIGNVDSSFSKVSTSIDMASRTLGYTPLKTLRLYHLPLIKSGALTAVLIVFVDCMKELPATLLLRPFNFETLATHIYQAASDEQIERAALGALFIVLAGLIPVILISRTISSSRQLSRRPG